MKSLLFFLLLILAFPPVHAQSIINYGPKGKVKTLSEYVELSLEPTSSAKSSAAPTAVVGIALGPVYSIISSTIKKSLEKRQKKFVASYTNSAEFSGDILKASEQKHSFLNQNLIIRRYAIDALNQVNPDHLMAMYHIRITPSTSPDKLVLDLQYINLNHAKAKYKEGEHLSLAGCNSKLRAGSYFRSLLASV